MLNVLAFVQLANKNGNIYKKKLLNMVLTGSGAHPVSYTMGTGCSFPGDKEGQSAAWP
jgi:hypothetical protein